MLRRFLAVFGERKSPYGKSSRWPVRTIIAAISSLLFEILFASQPQDSFPPVASERNASYNMGERFTSIDAPSAWSPKRFA
jgi:hypothetical protein